MKTATTYVINDSFSRNHIFVILKEYLLTVKQYTCTLIHADHWYRRIVLTWRILKGDYVHNCVFGVFVWNAVRFSSSYAQPSRQTIPVEIAKLIYGFKYYRAYRTSAHHWQVPYTSDISNSLCLQPPFTSLLIPFMTLRLFLSLLLLTSTVSSSTVVNIPSPQIVCAIELFAK